MDLENLIALIVAGKALCASIACVIYSMVKDKKTLNAAIKDEADVIKKQADTIKEVVNKALDNSKDSSQTPPSI